MMNIIVTIITLRAPQMNYVPGAPDVLVRVYHAAYLMITNFPT